MEYGVAVATSAISGIKTGFTKASNCLRLLQLQTATLHHALQKRTEFPLPVNESGRSRISYNTVMVQPQGKVFDPLRTSEYAPPNNTVTNE